MKLNNGGYDKETTLEFFNSHIIPIDLLQNLTDLEGVWQLEWCGKKFKDEGLIIEHVDTYLKKDKSSWRVQLHTVYHGETILSEWYEIVHIIQKYGLDYVGKRERIWVELTDSTTKVIITYTFSIPYVESIPEFNTPEERREWAKSILEKSKK